MDVEAGRVPFIGVKPLSRRDGVTAVRAFGVQGFADRFERERALAGHEVWIIISATVLTRTILLVLLLALPALGDVERRYTLEVVDTASDGTQVKLSNGYVYTLTCPRNYPDKYYGWNNEHRCDDVTLVSGIVYQATSGKGVFLILIEDRDEHGNARIMRAARFTIVGSRKMTDAEKAQCKVCNPK